ncbi:MAG: PorT family protein [Flavobacteriia bacterium]|nr:MAG: PorT family protein [Flavobacteriia bacterium]
MIKVLRKLWVLGFGLLSFMAYSQSEGTTDQDDFSRYLEDQFYAGFGYNVLLGKPEGMVQRNLSYNLQAGFIKDIPLNQRRNFGIGLGFGYAVNSYYSNMVVSQDANAFLYEVTNTSDFKRSKLETHAVEFPFELRWRTSTAQEYKFWRIYAGAKLGYVFSGRSRVVIDSGTNGFSNNDIEKWQYGLMVNFGYNTWNIHVYYALNPLLKDGTVLDTGESINIRALRIGVIFYIL